MPKQFCGALPMMNDSDGLWYGVKEIMPRIKQWAGLSGTPKDLGSGVWGRAFRFGDKTLKITLDEREAANAALVRDNPHPNVYHIYKVARIKPLETAIYDVFAIVYDYLEKPTYSMALAGNELFVLHSIKKFIKNWPESAEREWGELDHSTKHYHNLEQLVRALKHLLSLGIVFEDCHGDNIMRQGDQLVVIDIGLSASRKKAPIDILEQHRTKGY